MSRILIAASDEPRAILEQILFGHELICAETMDQARQFLSEGTFDLIVCTIIFDGSKMFDFLRMAKSTAEWKPIPFICVRVRSNILRYPEALHTVAFTCGTLGAQAFLDIKDYEPTPRRGMRDAIGRFLVTAS